MTEYHDQCAIFNWAKIKERDHPELALLNASQNGAWMANPRQAVNAKRAGMKRGYPDIFLPVKRGDYSGLFIELKYGKNKPTPEQKEWLQKLSDQGFQCHCAWGADAAIELIEGYLNT